MDDLPFRDIQDILRDLAAAIDICREDLPPADAEDAEAGKNDLIQELELQGWNVPAFI